MVNSASVNYIKIEHHIKFNYSEMKNLQPKQFVSSPVFHALGNEWVIDCYPRGSCREWSSKTSFLVRLHSANKTVNPTFRLSLMMRDGTTYPLIVNFNRTLNGTGSSWLTVQKSPFKGQVVSYGEFYPNSLFEKRFVKDGSFELICIIETTDIPHNRCSLGVLMKSIDLQSQIGKLLESSEKTDVTFHVENRSFMCHRLILAARSPVFNAMLFGNMVEATQQQIKIADMCPEVLEAMLHFIYTDSFTGCNPEKSSMKFTQHLFVAADRYALEGLKALYEDKLCDLISLDTVTTTLALALQHNSTHLKNACLDFIAEPGNFT